MIRYIPVRDSLSASVKEERTFSTKDDLMSFLLEKTALFFQYIGKDVLPKITFGDSSECRMIGWKECCSIILDGRTIGFCGE